MQIGDEVEGLLLSLQCNVLPNGPKVVAPVEAAGWLYAGEYFHG
jgi:hypothetical protein